jgi:hypothetical protein
MDKVFYLMWLSDVAKFIWLVGIASAISAAIGIAFLALIASAEEGMGLVVRGARVLKWLMVPIVIACVTPSSTSIQILAVASAVEAAASTKMGTKSIEAVGALLEKVIKEAKK